MASISTSMTARSTATSSACARSSRRSIPNSARSKLPMASVIDTATADTRPGPERAPEPAPVSRPMPAEAPAIAQPQSKASQQTRGEPRNGLRWLPRFRWRAVSPLTRRIVAVNVLPLALLAVGFLYLGKFESSLIGQQIESLRTQGEIFAAALSEGAVLDSGDEGEILLPDLARQMMRRLVEPTRTRARLFDIQGKQIADSRLLRGPGDAVQVMELPPPERKSLLGRVTDQIYDWIVELMPSRHKHPPYRESDAGNAEDYSEAMRALRGESGSAVRSDPQTGGLAISVAVPVHRYKQVLGAVMLSSSNGEVEEELRTVRLELLRIFGVALLVTILLSLYLASTIARPLRRLADAADRARGRGARVEIPDLIGRGDQMGELSRSLRDMTDALWQRMSARERYAADVAHEIKNPLSSLRSAVETVGRIEDPVKRRRLMAIIQDDVERLDRLISDISDASRLDAELSRQEVAPTDIGAMLRALVDMHETTRGEGAPHLTLDIAGQEGDLIVSGIETRLSQVFINVVANAVSFSPPDGEIRIHAGLDGPAVLVGVGDQGPGMASDKLTPIFGRISSEPPARGKWRAH